MNYVFFKVFYRYRLPYERLAYVLRIGFLYLLVNLEYAPRLRASRLYTMSGCLVAA